MTIKDAVWFNPTASGAVDYPPCIGIVLVHTGYGHKAYIGIGDGHQAGIDALNIAQRGARFHKGAAFWPEITDWEL